MGVWNFKIFNWVWRVRRWKRYDFVWACRMGNQRKKKRNLSRLRKWKAFDFVFHSCSFEILGYRRWFCFFDVVGSFSDSANCLPWVKGAQWKLITFRRNTKMNEMKPSRNWRIWEFAEVKLILPPHYAIIGCKSNLFSLKIIHRFILQNICSWRKCDYLWPNMINEFWLP